MRCRTTRIGKTSIFGPFTNIHQGLAKFHPFRFVDVKNRNGRATGLCATNQD